MTYNGYTLLLMWSIIGIFPYQIIVLCGWLKDHPKEVYLTDLLKSIPFGCICMLASLLVGVANINRVQWK